MAVLDVLELDALLNGPDDPDAVEVCPVPAGPPGMLELWRLKEDPKDPGYSVKLLGYCESLRLCILQAREEGPGVYRACSADGRMQRTILVEGGD